MIKILGKALLDREQIIAKGKMDCRRLEISLDGVSDLSIDNGMAMRRLAESMDMTIEIVHVPLATSKYHLGLGDLSVKSNMDLLECVFNLTDALGAQTVVAHVNESYKRMCYIEQWDSNVVQLKKLLEEHPNISIVFENILPLELTKGLNCLRDGHLFENVKLVKMLRKDTGIDRIGTCLDTCHALASTQFYDLLRSHGCTDDVYVIEDFFRENADLCKLLHLADGYKLGLVKKEHGIIFKEKDRLDSLLYLYNKYNYSCPITLEISEDDYCTPTNYLKLNKAVTNYFSKEDVLIEGGNSKCGRITFPKESWVARECYE